MPSQYGNLGRRISENLENLPQTLKRWKWRGGCRYERHWISSRSTLWRRKAHHLLDTKNFRYWKCTYQFHVSRVEDICIVLITIGNNPCISSYTCMYLSTLDYYDVHIKLHKENDAICHDNTQHVGHSNRPVYSMPYLYVGGRHYVEKIIIVHT